MKSVIRHSGVPTIAQFAGAPGPAIVIDTDTGTQYWLDAGDTVTAVSGGSGVTDHGALSGLADDDHTQYHNDTRGDARYSALGHTHTASSVTDFSEAVDDRVSSLLVAGSNVTLTYDDGANTLTVAASSGGGGSPAMSWVI